MVSNQPLTQWVHCTDPEVDTLNQPNKLNLLLRHRPGSDANIVRYHRVASHCLFYRGLKWPLLFRSIAVISGAPCLVPSLQISVLPASTQRAGGLFTQYPHETAAAGKCARAAGWPRLRHSTCHLLLIPGWRSICSVCTFSPSLRESQIMSEPSCFVAMNQGRSSL